MRYDEIETLPTDALVLMYQSLAKEQKVNRALSLGTNLSKDYVWVEILARCLPSLPRELDGNHIFPFIEAALENYDPEQETFEEFLTRCADVQN